MIRNHSSLEFNFLNRTNNSFLLLPRILLSSNLKAPLSLILVCNIFLMWQT